MLLLQKEFMICIVNPKLDPKLDPNPNPNLDPNLNPKLDPNLNPKLDPNPNKYNINKKNFINII
tara:strand:- start:35 stop:226 length:192 start_codon:yes stop_codon:yes gene_type:complete